MVRSTSASHHSRCVPLGAELAFDQAPALDEALERERDDGDAEAVAARDVVRRERAVRAREAEHEIADRIGDRLQVALGDAVRNRRAEGVAVARRVLDGDEALLARDGDLEDAALLDADRVERGASRRRASAPRSPPRERSPRRSSRS